MKPSVPIFTDLTKITRNSQHALTIVSIGVFDPTPWIRCGESDLLIRNKDTNTGVLKAYLDGGITDQEHDSAYAFQIPLIGIQWKYTQYGMSSFIAYVDSHDLDGFRVPRGNYDPATLPDVALCENECGEGNHLVVPSSHWAGPPPDRDLFSLLRGRVIQIQVGSRDPEAEE